jgi:hypothetical protein
MEPIFTWFRLMKRPSKEAIVKLITYVGGPDVDSKSIEIVGGDLSIAKGDDALGQAPEPSLSWQEMPLGNNQRPPRPFRRFATEHSFYAQRKSGSGRFYTSPPIRADVGNRSDAAGRPKTGPHRKPPGRGRWNFANASGVSYLVQADTICSAYVA